MLVKYIYVLQSEMKVLKNDYFYANINVTVETDYT